MGPVAAQTGGAHCSHSESLDFQNLDFYDQRLVNHSESYHLQGYGQTPFFRLPHLATIQAKLLRRR
jgi:hypothetical protein